MAPVCWIVIGDSAVLARPPGLRGFIIHVHSTLPNSLRRYPPEFGGMCKRAYHVWPRPAARSERGRLSCGRLRRRTAGRQPVSALSIFISSHYCRVPAHLSPLRPAHLSRLLRCSAGTPAPEDICLEPWASSTARRAVTMGRRRRRRAAGGGLRVSPRPVCGVNGCDTNDSGW